MSAVDPVADGGRARRCHAGDEARGRAAASGGPAGGSAMSPPKRQSVSRRGFLAAMAATSAAAGAFALGMSPSISVAAEAPAGFSTSFETWFEVEQPPTVPFEIVQI